MRTVLIAARKGGVGKTTLALHFSVIADKPRHPALLVDCDPQGSAEFWYGRREKQTPMLVKGSAGELPGILKDAAASGVETTIVDSPPFDAAGMASMMRVADLVVIPARPGILDLQAVGATIEAAKSVGTPFVCLINHGLPGRGQGEPSVVAETRAVLDSYGAPVLPGYVAQRASLAHALIDGRAVNEFEPEGRAAAEIAASWALIDKILRRK